MKDNKIIRLPYSKTYRQHKRLDELEFDRLMKLGRRRNMFKFIGIVLLVLIIGASLVYMHYNDYTIFGYMGDYR